MIARRRMLLWLMMVLGAPCARAGWIEDLPDRTVIHLTLFNLPDPSRVDAATRADAAAVKAFVRRFPDLFAARYEDRYRAAGLRYGRHRWDRVEVRLHRFSGIQVEGVESTLLAIAGDMAPDVLYVNFRQSDTYIRQGFLYPLDRPADGYLAAMPAEEQAARIHPKIWPVIQRRGPEGTTQVWALPYGGALGRVVLYRKDLFDAARLPAPTNDWTWADFLQACRAITDPQAGVYGVGLSRGKHESYLWMSFLWSAGGEALEYETDHDTWRAVFDRRAAAVALDFYTRLCTEPWLDARGRRQRGYALKDPQEVYARWERGQIGMIFAYIDEKLFSVINPDVTGMAPVPIGPGGHRGAELNSRMMGLFSGIKEPAVRDAAWEYIRFFDSPEAARIKTRVMVEGGLGRFLNPHLLREAGYPEIARLSPPGWEECFRIALDTARPEPYGRDSNYAYDLMSRPLQEAEELALRDRLAEDPERRLDQLQELLARAAQKTNEEMLGHLTPRQARLRRASAWGFLLWCVAAFTWALRRVAQAFQLRGGAAHRPPPRPFRQYAPALLWLLPAALSIAVWQYYPLIKGTLMAFLDYQVVGRSRWVGLENFGALLWSPDWWRAIGTSLRYSVLVMLLTFLPPVVLAILLQEIPRGKILFRMLFYLPATISGLVIILLWKSFYDAGETGLLNRLYLHTPVLVFPLLGLLALGLAFWIAPRLWRHRARAAALLVAAAGAGLALACLRAAWPLPAAHGMPAWARWLATPQEPIRWLRDSRTALLSCVLPLAWAGMGPGSLIYLAALKTIPDELYEAADMDGATFLDKVLFIVIPMLKPLLIINFTGVFIASWNAEANILAMTGGAAGTEVAGLHIFYKAFIFLKFGPATAMAWMLGCMLIGFTASQLRILARIEFRAAGNEP